MRNIRFWTTKNSTLLWNCYIQQQSAIRFIDWNWRETLHKKTVKWPFDLYDNLHP